MKWGIRGNLKINERENMKPRFRLRDTTNNQWLDVGEHFSFDKDGNLCPMWKLDGCEWSLDEYTGYEDSLGVPVFKNDLTMSAGGRESYQIIWDKSGWKLRSVNNKNRIVPLYPNIVRQQVKGNIYQTG
jgi:hypothetical protein